MYIFCFFSILQFFICFPFFPAVVTDKVALVIGNKDYECEKLRGLFYPETDTQDVAAALWDLGFKVQN